MGQTVTLTASDGFRLGGYRADPAGAPKGAIVVIQEIFDDGRYEISIGHLKKKTLLLDTAVRMTGRS